MISCFKRSATDDWKTDFENTHAVSYASTSNLSDEGRKISKIVESFKKFDVFKYAATLLFINIKGTSDLSDEGPKISKIVESFKKFDIFKYAAYRTAFKLRTVQKASKLHLVSLAVIDSVLKQSNYNSQSLDETVSTNIAAEIIYALYAEASKNIGFTEDISVMTHLFCAFLHNAFVEKENPMLLVQIKIALILFSSAKLSEKQKYMFYHCSTDGIMNKKGLQILLRTLSKVTEVLGEQVTFGSYLVPNAVQSCLKYCKGKITEKRFRKWLSLDPQTLVWLSTLHRIAIAETTEHFIQCDYCQISPTVGFRYKCLQCINYNLCQNCFLRGYYNKGHKEGHFVQEFCQPASVWQETKSTLNAVKNKLPFARCPSKAYLSYDEESLCESNLVIENESQPTIIARNQSLRKSTSAYLIKELSSIISQLDQEQKQIAALESTKDSQSNVLNTKPLGNNLSKQNSLQEVNSHLGAQLERLRNLLKCIKAPDSIKKELGIVSPVPHVPFHNKDHYFESTPMNSAVVNPLQSKENLPEFSVQSPYSPNISEKQRDCSSDYSRALQTSSNENFTFSTTYGLSNCQSPSISLELTTILNNSSPKGLSTRLSELNGDVSKLSPLYVYSSVDLEEPASGCSGELSSAVSPNKNNRLRSTELHKSTFTLDKDGNLEIMEQELQAMLQHLEELLPQVSFLANDSKIEKEKVVSALSEMEDAILKLSHLSFEISTGSTDL